MKRVLLLSLAVTCALGLALPAFGETTRPVNGVAVPVPDAAPADPANEGPMSTEVSPLGGSYSSNGYTGVDDLSPCYFAYALPAGKAFKQYGITFKGPSKLDGAAVLDECDGWSITGFSPASILAFNCGSTLSNGGHPVGPETLVFTPTVDAVQLDIGGGTDAGQTVEILARTAEGGLVDSQIVTLTSAMQQVFLSGSKKIKKVVIGATANTSACIYAVDNIYWGTPK